MELSNPADADRQPQCMRSALTNSSSGERQASLADLAARVKKWLQDASNISGVTPRVCPPRNAVDGRGCPVRGLHRR